jgi:hypothetical protein
MTARMHLAHGIAGIALFALLAGCGATGPGQMEAERIDSVEDYIAYHRDLREGLASGMYGEITEHDARIFNEAQGTIFDHVTGIDSLADLSDDARLEVFNAQETINALIRGKDPKAGPFVSERKLLAMADEAEEQDVIEEQERALILDGDLPKREWFT